MKNSLLFIWETAKVVIFALLIVLPIRYFLFQPFMVRGMSMDPNFVDGDYLIVDQISYRFNNPERGEVIVFKYPKDPSKRYIKRVIGLPGEEVVVNSGDVTIEGKMLAEDYLDFEVTPGNMDLLLSDGEYFVLGDNRPSSSDSRKWGVLPEENIIGKVIFRISPFTAFARVESPAY